MKKKHISEKKLFPSLDPLTLKSSGGNEFSARLPWNYSPPVLAVEGAEQYPLVYSNDVHLTIRLKVQEVTRKQITLLAGQSLYEVLHFGLTLGDWMVLEFLYSYLLGSKSDSTFLYNYKEVELALLLKVVLISGTWLGLEEKVQLPEDIKFLLTSSKWVPSSRTYSSRKDLFRLSKYLQVRIVPVNDLIDRSKGNVRYSSYCKGYGESSHMGRRQKTRPSAELDGVPVDLEKETSTKVPLNQIGRVLQIELLELKYSHKKKL